MINQEIIGIVATIRITNGYCAATIYSDPGHKLITAGTLETGRRGTYDLWSGPSRAAVSRSAENDIPKRKAVIYPKER